MCSPKEVSNWCQVGRVPGSCILNIGIPACSMSACTCSALAVCTIFTLHHHDFFTVSSFAPITSSSVIRAKPIFHVVIRFSLSSSCACLASSLRLTARLLTCSREGK